MPNCEQLIIDIQETIRENGNNEITGPVLQDVLLDIVYALCNEQPAFDDLTMWRLLGAATEEQINVSHLSATDVAGMLTQAGYKLTDTTYALATDAVAGLLKTGYAENGKNYAVKLDDIGRAYVNVPWTDKFDTYFGVDEDGNVYVKNNRGFYGNSFISARGSDPGAGSGGGSGVDMESVWYALAQPTNEKINVSHIPALTISKITGLQDALDAKLEGITKAMVEAVLTGTVTSHNHDGRYAPLSGGLIPSQYLPSYVDDVVEYASLSAFPATGEGGKIYVALDTNLTYRWGGTSYVEISPSLALGHTAGTAYPGDEGAALAERVEAMKAITDLFGIDGDGNVYVKDNKGFWSNSFVSARGGDPAAGSGGGSGVDMESVWYALAQPTTEKINVSHIPALQQLSGSLTNAQLANSAITVAGVSVSLGGAVSTEQIASALGLGSNAYTSTAYLPLAGGTMTGHITLGGANSSSLLVQMRVDNSNYRRALGWKSAASGTLIAQIGYWNSAQKITLNPCSDEVSEIWNDAAGKYNFVVGKNWLSYNTYPILHSVNYTDYTVTKTGVGASGTWPISVSGTAADASKLGGIYSAEYMSHFRQSGVNIDTYATRSPKIIEVSEAAGTKPLPSLWLQVMQWGSNNAAYGFQMANRYSEYGSVFFRQKVGGTWGGWRTLLDTANYATLIDTRYVKKSGDTMNGTLTLLCGGDNYDQGIRINRPTLADWATLTIGCVGSGTSGTTANTWLIGTPANSNSLIFCQNDSSDQKGLCLRDMTNTGMRWNGYGVWHAGCQGSGSGLDADLLDGYQATSFQFAVSHNYELSLSGGRPGRYVILLHPDTLNSANNSLPVGYSVQGTFHLFRPLGNGTASIIVKSGAGYSSTWNSGSIIAMPDYNCFTSMKLVTCNYGGKLYRALFVDAAQDIVNLYFRGVVMNRDTNFGLAVKYYDYGTSAVTNSEVNGSIADFQRYRAILSPQLIEGTITSAQKLATTRSIWGQPFDGTQGVDGYIYLGSSDYRLYFGTSGVTSFLTGANGIFQLHKSNGTSSQRVLFAVNLGSENVGIGTVTPTEKLHVVGIIRATTGVYSDGYVSAKGQDTTSDARYKRDIAALPAQAALAVLMRLRPSTWAWKDDGRRGAGFVAQEVLGVLPEAVREVGNGEDRHLALNYQMLHAYEVSALQTHETELERLRGRVNQLENEIKRIRHGS